MPVDHEALRSSISRLTGTGLAEMAVEEVLQEVVDAVGLVFGLAGAGVLIIDEQRELRSVITSDAGGEALEQCQLDTGHGPCIDAFVNNATTACADLAEDPRYVSIGRKLVDRGVHAVLGVPIRLGGGPVGSLNVYDDKPHAWHADEQRALESYTALLSSLLHAVMTADRRTKVTEQLSYALDYRIPIERAVGFLMARHDTDAVDAFNLLRRTARDQRRRVAEVAEELLTRREPR